MGDSQARTSANVADRLSKTARQMPDVAAVIVQRAGFGGRMRYERHTFCELDEDSTRIAQGLSRMGVGKGARLALLVPPSYEFITLVFAIFKAGAIEILIDPGMGRRNLLRCLAEAEPDGFVAIPAVHAVRRLFSRRFPRARFNATVGRHWFLGETTLDDLRQAADGEKRPLPCVTDDDPAAIIFTTGSTGPPKGVLYRHGNFNRQVDEIRERYQIQPGEIDLACFPLFALFNSAMGVSTVIPDMDASRPARVNPAHIIAAVMDLSVTQSFGSPAVWNRVGKCCQDHGARLPTLKRVLSAGAPVPARVLAMMKACIHADGEVHTPYGATEALPVATIAASEVLGETAARTDQGAGVCVGRQFAGIEWRVIQIVDGPIASIAGVEELPHGAIGELIVRGPVVTREYVTRREANALGKIADGSSVWHRMGDAGYLDAQGRFWFCGRVAHRVRAAEGTMYTIPCEAIFNVHADVHRTALVGVGRAGQARPVIIVEPLAGHWPRSSTARHKLLEQILALGKANALTAPIDDFLIHRSFPVDIRHNAKIFREKLAVWAAKRLAGQVEPTNA